MRSRRRRLIVLVIAFFLATHVVCVCATPAVASGATARSHAAGAGTPVAADPHACCHPKPAAPAPRESTPPCPHCSHGTLATADATLQLPPPTIAAVPLFLLQHDRALPHAATRTHRLDDPGGVIAALPVLAHTTVLRL